ncbi:2-hydroxy-6-oxononadienedioate/2-hydroxy-6-oxononatrienedioate hydrolase 2-like [Asterias amurensis]|uniref:2-hydroxy-6-oxononadienedioate/2-hydroxy-6- oxononatrienedioate hydrolase 2-like n=1 Tax=Asterias amurensis TaxID=7602 RepID=UPI003AB4ACF7
MGDSNNENKRDGVTKKPAYNFTTHTEEVQALGTRFKVVYADEGDKSGPVILCIHGAPATHKSYRHLVHGLTSHGYRVILPNLPGMGLTELDPDGVYNHTTEHKAVVIKELLSKLGVKSVAMVAGHSMGGHVTCQLAADPAQECSIKSICLLSSAGARPHKLFSPYWLFYILGVVLYFGIQIPLIGPAMRRLASGIVSSAGLRGLTRDSEVFSFYEGSQLNFKEFISNVSRLAEINLPAICIYSQNDNFVERPVLEDTIQRLGMNLSDTLHYDKEGIKMEKSKDGATKRSVLFEKGTHMVHYVYPDEVVKEMVSFLQTVVQPK